METENGLLKARIKSAWKDGYEAGKIEVTKVFEAIFSPAKIKSLMTNKRVNWGTEDISGAIALHACDRKAYVFVRKCMKIPLPAERTIHRWAAKIKIRPGLQEEVLNVLGKLAKVLTEQERLVCLSFDEIQLSQRAQFDSAREAVVGPHKHAQVVMMRPLYGTWKQPVYCQFDENMTKNIFESVAKKLYEIGFTVVASVCDLGSTNQTFLTQMGVYGTGICSSPHPSNSDLQIFFFADCPHLLKLFRNHFIGAGFRLNGARFGPEILTTTINIIKR